MSEPHIRLVAKLKGTSAVTALVVARIWPMIVPQGQALPYIVYRRVDSVPINHAHGTTADDFTRIQIDCCASTYDGARALADEVRGDEDESNPTGLSGWIDGDNRVWHLEIEQDGMEPPWEGTDRPAAFIVSQDYIV